MDFRLVQPAHVNGLAKRGSKPLDYWPDAVANIDVSHDGESDGPQRGSWFIGSGRFILSDKSAILKHCQKPVDSRRSDTQGSAHVGEPDIRVCSTW